MRHLRVPGWWCHSPRWGTQRAEALGKAGGESSGWAALPRLRDTHEETASGHRVGWVRNSDVWTEVKYRCRSHPSLTQQMVTEHLIDASPQYSARKLMF